MNSERITNGRTLGRSPAGIYWTEVQVAPRPALSGLAAVYKQGELKPVAHVQLAEDGPGMGLDGALGYAQLAGDFLVAGTTGNCCGNLALAFRQQRRPVSRCLCRRRQRNPGGALKQPLHQGFADPEPPLRYDLRHTLKQFRYGMGVAIAFGGRRKAGERFFIAGPVGVLLYLTKMNQAVLSSMVINMVDVGEESGELDTMLYKVADTYDEEVSALTESLMSLMEPLLIICLGGMVGFIVIALFMPLISLIQKLSGG